MLCLCVNVQNYRATIKLYDTKFRKTDRIWNRSFQKVIIVEVRLRRRFMQDGVGGERLLQKYEDIG